MALKFRKLILLAGIEATAGTDPGLTGAANAILTHKGTISPMEGDVTSRELDRPVLGNDEQLHVGTHVKMEFYVELAGSGTPGTPPAWGVLMRGCGMAETVVAATSVAYDPVSAGEESMTFYMHLDGQKHAMTYARGSVSLDITPGQIPRLKFVFTGLWVDPSSVADPTPVFSAFVKPLPVTNANTPNFTIHGETPNMLGLTFDQANDVVYRNVVGEESVQIIDRAPKGSVKFEAPPLSTKNWFTTAKANTTGALNVTHGVAAGNIVAFDGPIVQVLNPKYGESDGIRTIEAETSFIPGDAGDNDFKFTVT